MTQEITLVSVAVVLALMWLVNLWKQEKMQKRLESLDNDLLAHFKTDHNTEGIVFGERRVRQQ